METNFNFITKERGRKGEGRATVFKAVQLPVDIIDELKLYRDIYGALQSKTKDSNGNPIPEKVKSSCAMIISNSEKMKSNYVFRSVEQPKTIRNIQT